MPARGMGQPMVVEVDGIGGETEELAGDTREDAQDAVGQQLPGLPPMTGQDGKPLIVPIQRDDAGR